MLGWQTPLDLRWAVSPAGLLVPSLQLVSAPPRQLISVGFAGPLPVPNYGIAAALPLSGRVPAGWNLDGMPWSALFVPDKLDPITLDLFCELLTALDVHYLLGHPEAPDLYRSGVRYQLMPQTEYWLTVPWALAFARAGLGVDCKTLAAWRTAELRVRYGEPSAKCIGKEFQTESEHVFHVRVQRANGSIEDPSALLGMRSVTQGPAPYTGLWRP